MLGHNQLQESYIPNVPLATARDGRLKEQRREKGKLIIRDDLASLEYINEDIILDNLKRHFNKKQV